MPGRTRRAAALALGLCSLVAQAQEDGSASSALKRLSFEELMDVEVTSVSRRPQPLAETAAAIQVVSAEDIRRFGATRIPEALRLASNLQVAQIDSANWAISARGFNTAIANKLLVLIDGRTVYTPLFAGVFWDVQDTLIEDLDRIEVISGPGATAWGANAVNGVINIVSRDATDTQGLLVTAGGGTELEAAGGVRYGGRLGPDLHYRVYGKYTERDSTVLAGGGGRTDDWHAGRGGFRLDWQRSETDRLTLQGGHYDGATGVSAAEELTVHGGDVIGRWTRTLSDRSDWQLQAYFDRTFRRSPAFFVDRLDTYDVDFQHRFPLGRRHDLVWGVGYRRVENDFDGSPALALIPARISLSLYSAFVQDEISLANDRVQLSVGTKLEHNDYTGFEFQPSIRLATGLGDGHTVWAAVSRAVRSPSRIERDLFQPDVPPFVLIGGDFDSEELLAYELGFRAQPIERLALSVAAYYNDYDELRSIEPAAPPAPLPLTFANGLRGHSYGVELSADYRLAERWGLSAGFTHVDLSLRPKPGSQDPTGGGIEAHDPDYQFFLRSSLNLPRGMQLDASFRHVARIANEDVPAYSELDLRLGWQPRSGLEVSIVGQSLLHDRHAEFGALPVRREIERSVYGKIVWQF